MARNFLSSPSMIEHIEKAAMRFDRYAIARERVIGIKSNLRLRKRTQNIEARMSRAMRDAFEQRRITCRLRRGQREQIVLAAENTRDDTHAIMLLRRAAGNRRSETLENQRAVGAAEAE